MTRGPWIDHFGDNFLWSNATLILKGMAPYGVVALEEIDRVCERLRGRQTDPLAWREEWCAMGAQLESRADAALAKNHRSPPATTTCALASITITPSVSSRRARKSERRPEKRI